MAMDFPNSPSVNDTYTGTRSPTTRRTAPSVNGLLYGTTDWIDENIYPDYIILGMQD